MKILGKESKPGRMVGLLLAFQICASFGADPTVSIGAFQDRTIAQRVSEAGSFAAKGTYTGNLTGIQVRVVRSDGTEVRPWKNANVTATSKTWNATLDNIAQGGWYRLEARYLGQTSPSTKSATRFGVGMILVMMGQSNMELFCLQYGASPTTIKPHPLTVHAKHFDFKWFDPVVKPDSGLPVVLFANNLAEAMNIPVGVIHLGYGSSSIDEWLGDFTKGNRRPAFFLKKAIKVAGGDVEMLLWYQGFNDFGAGTPGATVTPDSLKTAVWNKGWDDFEKMADAGSSSHLPYYEKLSRLYTMATQSVRRKDLLMLCGVKGRSFREDHIENSEVWNQINKAPWDWSLAQSNQVNCVRWSQMAWAKDHPNGRALGNGIDLRMNESAHNIPRERFTLASRFAQSVLHAAGAASYGGGGPLFMSEQTSIVDGGILVKVKHQGGNKLVVPFPGRPIEGFTVRVPGRKESLAIKKISLRQPDGVFIELVEPPTAGMLVTYLTGPAPISDFKGVRTLPWEQNTNNSPGNILYDNAQLPAGNTRPGNMVNGTLGCLKVLSGGYLSGKPRNMSNGPDWVLSFHKHIGYTLLEDSHVSLRLYDSQGRLSTQLVNGIRGMGTHWEKPKTKALSSGMYVVTLKSNNKIVSRKVMICR